MKISERTTTSTKRPSPRSISNIAVVSLTIAVLLLSFLTVVPAVRASGQSAEWHVSFSFTCNGACVTALGVQGGQRGSMALNSDGTGNAEVAAGPGAAGHDSVQILGWTIGPNGDFVLLGEIDTITSHGTTTVLTFSPEYADLGIPAAAGHYNAMNLCIYPVFLCGLGVSIPGLELQIQVSGPF
jgi:hypothetical protein